MGPPINWPKRSKVFMWKCRHCTEEVTHGNLKEHMFASHCNVKLSAENKTFEYLSTHHFNQGRYKAKQDHPSRNYWKCNHCGKKMMYYNLKAHLQTKLHDDIDIDATTLSEISKKHFTQGKGIDEDKSIRKCKHCNAAVVYSCLKWHILSEHGDLQLASNDLRYLSIHHFKRTVQKSKTVQVNSRPWEWLSKK